MFSIYDIWKGCFQQSILFNLFRTCTRVFLFEINFLFHFVKFIFLFSKPLFFGDRLEVHIDQGFQYFLP